MIKAVIFDKDGLMFDSEKLQHQSFRDVLTKYGHKYPKKLHRQFAGHSADFTYSSIQKLFKIKDINTFIEKRREHYRELSAKKLKMMPGLLDLVKKLKKKGYKLAVASGSHSQGLKQELDQFNLTSYFDFILSGEGLLSKPAPDIFLIVAKKLKIKPSQCLVLEDSQPGVEAAKAAGMSCIAIPSKYTQHQDFSKADEVVKNLGKVIPLLQIFPR